MGWLTLLVFPIPVFLTLYYLEDKSYIEILEIHHFSWESFSWGILLGLVYAVIANQLLKLNLFESIPLKIDDHIRSMNLTIADAIFLSACAAIGEELLFRAGIQYYLGPILTSILFVAVHGYLNIKSWKKSLYGLIVLPLSFLLGYGFEYVGLWFSIAIHFSYDLLLFLTFIYQKK